MSADLADLLRLLRDAFSRLDMVHMALGGALTDLALRRAGGRVRDPVPPPAALDLIFEALTWGRFDAVAGELERSGLQRTERSAVIRCPGGPDLFLWPFGSGVSAGDRLTWRDSGAEYSTAGFDLVLNRARPEPVEPGLDVLVPSLSHLVYTRIVFYLGRMEVRDLGEMVTVLEAAPRAEGDIPGSRRLGAELRDGLPPRCLQGVRVFLSELEAVHAPMISRLFRQRGGVEPSEGWKLETVFSLFRDFRDGLGPG